MTLLYEGDVYFTLHFYNAVIEFVYFVIIHLQNSGPKPFVEVGNFLLFFKVEVSQFVSSFKGADLVEKCMNMLCTATPVFYTKNGILYLSNQYTNFKQTIFEELVISHSVDLVLRGVSDVSKICDNLNSNSVIKIKKSTLYSILNYYPYFYVNKNDAVLIIYHHSLVEYLNRAYDKVIKYFLSIFPITSAITYHDVKDHNQFIPSCGIHTCLYTFCILISSQIFNCSRSELHIRKNMKLKNLQPPYQQLNIVKLNTMPLMSKVTVTLLVLQSYGPKLCNWSGSVSYLMKNAGLIKCVVDYKNYSQDVFFVYFPKSALKLICDIKDISDYVTIQDIVQFDAKFYDGKAGRYWMATKVSISKHAFREKLCMFDIDTNLYEANIFLASDFDPMLKAKLQNLCSSRNMQIPHATKSVHNEVNSDNFINFIKNSFNFIDDELLKYNLLDTFNSVGQLKSQSFDDNLSFHSVLSDSENSKLFIQYLEESFNFVDNEFLKYNLQSTFSSSVEQSKSCVFVQNQSLSKSNLKLNEKSLLQSRNLLHQEDDKEATTEDSALLKTSEKILKEKYLTSNIDINEKIKIVSTLSSSLNGITKNNAQDTRVEPVNCQLSCNRNPSSKVNEVNNSLVLDLQFLFGEVETVAKDGGVINCFSEDSSCMIFFLNDVLFTLNSYIEKKQIKKQDQVLVFIPYLEEDSYSTASLVYVLKQSEIEYVVIYKLTATEFVLNYFIPSLKINQFKLLHFYHFSHSLTFDMPIKLTSCVSDKVNQMCLSFLQNLSEICSMDSQTQKLFLQFLTDVRKRNLVIRRFDKYLYVSSLLTFVFPLAGQEIISNKKQNLRSKLNRKKLIYNLMRDCDSSCSIDKKEEISESPLMLSKNPLLKSNSIFERKKHFLQVERAHLNSGSSFESLSSSSRYSSDDVFYTCESSDGEPCLADNSQNSTVNNLEQSSQVITNKNILVDSCLEEKVVSSVNLPKRSRSFRKLNHTFLLRDTGLSLVSPPIFKIPKRKRKKLIISSASHICSYCLKQRVEAIARVSLITDSCIFATVSNGQKYHLCVPKSDVPEDLLIKIQINSPVEVTFIPNVPLSLSHVLSLKMLKTDF